MVEWSSLVSDRKFLVGVAVAAVAAFSMATLSYRHRQKHYELVGHVTALNCYPIKSCGGISADAAFCTKLGIRINGALDRQFMIVRPNGNFITQRQLPKMCGISTSCSGNELFLEAEGMPRITVTLNPVLDEEKVVPCRMWGVDAVAQDCGPEIGAWLSKYLKEEGLRLLVTPTGLQKRQCALPSSANERMTFPDESPYHIATEESLEDLKSRITSTEAEITMTTFRPNIVVKGTSQAWDEDTWQDIRIGQTVSGRVSAACDRCLMTTVDRVKQERRKDQEPLKTLRAFRSFPAISKSPLFGIFNSVHTEGEIRVGDEVLVTRK